MCMPMRTSWNSFWRLWRTYQWSSLEYQCVKWGEGFCYFDCNIFYFGSIKLWYSRLVFCSSSASNSPNVGCFITKNILVTSDVFRAERKTFWCFAWQIGYGHHLQGCRNGSFTLPRHLRNPHVAEIFTIFQN